MQLGNRNNTALLKSVGTGECSAYDLKRAILMLKYSGHTVSHLVGQGWEFYLTRMVRRDGKKNETSDRMSTEDRNVDLVLQHLVL